MIEKKRKLKTEALPEMEDLREKLRRMKSQTAFGKKLLELSRANLESDVTILDAEEIMSELGRSHYE